jgi:DNA-binding MarR family transcriptional regulator
MQNTLISEKLKLLHASLLDIVTVMNRPQRDEVIIRAAGISLDRALFPLLVGVQRVGPIGVGELADRVGRDYTTVSRQVAKLENLGLVDRRPGNADKRVREAVITERGRELTDRIDAARERIGRAVFQQWDEQEFDNMVRQIRNLADTMLKEPPENC